MTSVTDPLHHTTTFEYVSGVLNSVTDPLGRVTRQFSDGGGRVVSITDPIGQTTRYTYDRNNAVLSITDALGSQTRLSYFPDGQLQTVTDATQHVTSYTYDVMGRVASRTDPLQRQDVFTYDVNGNPYTWINRKGQVTTGTYDALDRLHQIQYGDTSTITYIYDERDRLAQIDDNASGTNRSIVRIYDDFDRVRSETTPEGAISYTYDDAGRRQTMTVTGQSAVAYLFDDADRLIGVTRDTMSVGMSYDDANRRSTLTMPNGIVTEYGYDDGNQVTSITYRHGATTLGDLSYSYDASGRRTHTGGSWARTGLPQARALAVYDAANELIGWGPQMLSYDPNGNLASDGLTSYAWDARNQLTGLSGGTSVSFAYDGLGRRRGKTVGGTTTNFLYDGLNLVQELSGSTATANLLTGGGVDEAFIRTDASGTSAFLRDTLGSALALADASGAVLTQYTFDPFGTTTSSGATSSNALQFTGRENDGTGLYYFRARYQNAGLGRFVSEDPIGFQAGINLYAYADDSPINLVDPLGTQALPAPAPSPGPAWFPWLPWLSEPHDLLPRDYYVRESPYPKDKPKECPDWHRRWGCLASGSLTPTKKHENGSQAQLLVYALGYGDTEGEAAKKALDNVQSAVPPTYTPGWWYVRHPKIIKCWKQ